VETEQKPKAEMTWSEFLEEGEKRFGKDRERWRFVCRACGHVQSMADYMSRHPEAKREEVSSWIFFACEGRQDGKVGCNWSLGGLLHVQDRMLTGTGTEKGSCPVFLFEGEAGGEPFYTPRELPATDERKHDK